MSATFLPTDQPACLANPELFESERLEDHSEAKKVCDSCEFIAACETRLEEAIKLDGYGPSVGPRGTWAGKFLAPEVAAAAKAAAKERRNQRLKEKKDNPTPRPECGAVKGAWRHRHYKERTCEPCKRAEADSKAAKREGSAA